ncbi:I78 family peptidase inhibitor [Alcaligenes sp. SDU_A2]|uniref:I78 family peptidase inhibitor n=1 Tax=Alcaligenes sp. SDU_A2 TaxID=3136634 RepID=UPI002C19AE94|nr:I78 family peptidase inhibitor [Alcaligenes sp.]HRL26903.1 I78 family peptidase inhibitor [Alcaligenes sp.]
MRPSSLLTLLPTVLLAACTATGGASSHTPASSAQPDGGQCNADALNPAGQQASEKHVQSLVKQAGAVQARILYPDRMYTTDYDSTRLSIRVDAQNNIISVYCG